MDMYISPLRNHGIFFIHVAPVSTLYEVYSGLLGLLGLKNSRGSDNGFEKNRVGR